MEQIIALLLNNESDFSKGKCIKIIKKNFYLPFKNSEENEFHPQNISEFTPLHTSSSARGSMVAVKRGQQRKKYSVIVCKCGRAHCGGMQFVQYRRATASSACAIH